MSNAFCAEYELRRRGNYRQVFWSGQWAQVIFDLLPAISSLQCIYGDASVLILLYMGCWIVYLGPEMHRSRLCRTASPPRLPPAPPELLLINAVAFTMQQMSDPVLSWPWVCIIIREDIHDSSYKRCKDNFTINFIPETLLPHLSFDLLLAPLWWRRRKSHWDSCSWLFRICTCLHLQYTIDG